ncbi:MAG: hydrolase TatD [Bdellovibrionales bacterium RIFCSPHIGHO2_01_FULL_40_29]|nr:MAG: hydrolase TatD [Bdellovibrionales bacterium RIFCSPHIGHO2_01_FULL_40_29]OFZ33376.1 MAG: hydrolase TatD [Bdellovibrionales bacterium RIFCSPHIGHO2_02_FULL_40_15]
MLEWIDIHCHLDRLEGGPEVAFKLAQAAGVKKLITIGTEPEDLQIVLDLAKQFAPDVYCTLGIHPHEGVKYSDDVGKFLRENGSHPSVVAIGEIGLDYHYDQSPRDEQRYAFREQLKIAQNLQLPVEIHTRDAEEDTIAILSEFEGKVKGVIHCFTGTGWLATEALKLGYNISISGIVTFKNAQSIRDTVQNIIPLDRLHIETDAPFLAPVPMRGKSNTSAYMVHTAQVVADLKNVTLQQLSEQAKQNAKQMFKKLIWD